MYLTDCITTSHNTTKHTFHQHHNFSRCLNDDDKKEKEQQKQKYIIPENMWNTAHHVGGDIAL